MKIAFIVFLVLVGPFCFAQKNLVISGVAKNEKSEPVAMALIALLKKNSNAIISFCYTNEAGFYKLSYVKDTTAYVLQVNALGYLKQEHIIYPADSLALRRDLLLTVNTVTLNEVVVKSKAPGIKVRGDTTTYKANSFKNGTEKNVEDLLKKLPGVTVNDNGSISFKGKKIDKVFIDGDDLLGKNYKLATKNINATFIDEVDVIENFSDNPLLKSIENADKTILNLKVDKNKRHLVFGSIDASYGNNNFNDATLNLFSYTKAAKLYLIGAHNNIGNRSSPDDNQLTGIEKSNDDDPAVTSSPLVTTENLYYSQFKENRINFNDETLGSLLATYRPVKQLKLETNISLTTDRSVSSLLDQTVYTLNNKRLLFSEHDQLVNKPLTANIHLNLEYAINTRSRFRYIFEDRSFKTSTAQNIIFESDSSREAIGQRLSGNQSILHHQLNYTNRINEKNAITLDANYFNSGVPQVFDITTTGNRFVQLFNLTHPENEVLQNSDNRANELNAILKLTGVKNKFNYVLGTGIIYTREKVTSQVSLLPPIGDSIVEPEPYRNDVSLNKADYFVRAGTAYTLKKLKLSVNLLLHHLDIINEPVGVSGNNKPSYNYLEPAFTLQYKLSDASKLSGSLSSGKQFSYAADLYGNYLLTDYRTTARGLPVFLSQNTTTARIGYSYDDFYSQFNLSANLFLVNKTNAYGNDYYISETYDAISRIITPKSTIYLYVMQVDKYINPLFANIRFNFNYTINNYNSKLNPSPLLRDNTLKSAVYKLTYTTAFDNSVNFALGYALNTNSLRIHANDTTKTTGNNYSSGFVNAILKRKKYFFSLSNDLSFINRKAYYFLDGMATYYLKEKLSVSLTAKNLTNNSTFQQQFLNDYQLNTISYKVLPRYLLLGFNYSF